MAENAPRAEAYCEEVLAISEPRGEVFYRLFALVLRGIAAWRENSPRRADAMLRQALATASRTAHGLMTAWSVEGLAWISVSLHDHIRAATLFGVAQALADAAGTPAAMPRYLAVYHQDSKRQARAALGDEAFDSAFEQGLEMRRDDGLAYALESAAEIVPPSAAPVDPRPTQQAPGADAVDLANNQQGRVVRVLVADRHRVVADGIQLVLDQHPDLEVVGVATSADDAVSLAASAHPDVILADYQLPDATGAELTARLRKVQPTTHVLLLSAVVSNVLLQEAVKVGAQGFLLKTQPAQQLVDAVRRAAAGEVLIPAVRFLSGSSKGAELFDPLTGRERDVLRLLAAGLDNRQIAARMGIGYVTVRSHLRNLSTKLDAHSKVEVLARSAELGLIAR
jgi:DNA-binding NarL/FixJ family response regulator